LEVPLQDKNSLDKTLLGEPIAKVGKKGVHGKGKKNDLKKTKGREKGKGKKREGIGEPLQKKQLGK